MTNEAAEKRRAYYKAWRAANPEKVKANNAPTLVTSAGEVPMGTVIYKKMQEEPPAQKKDCPFQGGLYPQCKEDDCAFFKCGKCKPGTATAGKRCPLPAHLNCGNTCAMYKNGRCGLFPQQKGTKK